MEKKTESKKGLRTGFTTGACAAAAAKAAATALIFQKQLSEIEVTLPIGKKVKFKVEKCQFDERQATCSVLKDAGDDPDCTNGAEVIATVCWIENGTEKKIVLESGPGVGVVTKPGFGLEVGSPAINPVPRKNILDMVEETAKTHLKEKGLRVTFSVPSGEEMAKKTLNARLGIEGGISILGTTGIVVPFSTAAYKAIINQGIDIAVNESCAQLVLTTGGKSEEFAMKIFSHLKESAFVQMGDFVGHALKYCVQKRVSKVTLCGMPGKMSKIAMGKMQTHAAGGTLDMDLLVSTARDCGSSEEILKEIAGAASARHVQEIVSRNGVSGFWDRIAEKVCRACRENVPDQMSVECALTDFDGKILGRHEIAKDSNGN